MTQKATLFKGQQKKKTSPPNRHGKSVQSRKGKRNIKPSKFTKDMDSDRRDKAQEIWQYIMSKKNKDKPKVTKKFSYFEQYEVVEGFSQFADISTNMASSGGITAGESEGIHMQPSPTNSQVNLDNDGDVIAEDVDVRPPGRKAAKEAIRKGKNAAKNGSPMTSAVMSISDNQTSMLSYRKKRDEEYARLLKEQENRENIRLQMKMRNEIFKLQEREERIMEMDTSKMNSTKKSYWERKQKMIAEREENASSGYSQPYYGSYYLQPHFSGVFPQPSFTGVFPQPLYSGAFPQPLYSDVFPQPPYLGVFSQPPYPGAFPQTGGYYLQSPITDESNNNPANTD